MTVAWPIRSVLAGSAGTATLTLTYNVERRMRHPASEPLDYDDSLVPGEIVATVMHLPHVTQREEHELGLAYVAAVAAVDDGIRRRVGTS